MLQVYVVNGKAGCCTYGRSGFPVKTLYPASPRSGPVLLTDGSLSTPCILSLCVVFDVLGIISCHTHTYMNSIGVLNNTRVLLSWSVLINIKKIWSILVIMFWKRLFSWRANFRWTEKILKYYGDIDYFLLTVLYPWCCILVSGVWYTCTYSWWSWLPVGQP